MTSLGIVKSADSEEYTVKFSKPQFQEFINTVTTTPREERYDLELGYDVTKQRIKTLLDKVSYQIGTHSDLLSHQYTFTARLRNKREVTWNDYTQFFNTSDSLGSDVISLIVTGTYMVGFNRGDGQKIERQIISIEFRRQTIGWIRTRIMSTDITWAPSIYQLIEKELKELEPEGAKSPKSEMWPFRQIILALIGRKISNSVFGLIGETGLAYRSFSSVSQFALTAIISSQFIAMLVVGSLKRDKPMLNLETGLFETGNFHDYVEKMGLKAAAEHASMSDILYQIRYAEWATGHSQLERLANRLLEFASPWSAAVGVTVALIVLYCRRQAAVYLTNMQGRISLKDEPIAKREAPSKSVGVAESIFIGLLASTICASTVQFFKLLAS